MADQLAGRVLSVNVGQPRDVIWQGRTVHTAVWKDPVDGPQLVRRLNIDGDGQGDLAGHGEPARDRAHVVHVDRGTGGERIVVEHRLVAEHAEGDQRQVDVTEPCEHVVDEGVVGVVAGVLSPHPTAASTARMAQNFEM